MSYYTDKMAQTISRGAALVPITFRHSTIGKEYLRIRLHIDARWAPIKLPSRTQFLGVHHVVFATLERPAHIDTMEALANDFRAARPYGDVLWLGRITITNPPSLKNITEFYIPHQVWWPGELTSVGPIMTRGLIRKIRVGVHNNEYTILELPGFERERMLPEFFRNK